MNQLFFVCLSQLNRRDIFFKTGKDKKLIWIFPELELELI